MLSMLSLFVLWYIFCMAVAIRRAGRPHYVAVMDYSNDAEVRFREEFYRACADFHYREIMALSRALGVDVNTVERWKYKLNFPSWYVAYLIIDWVKRGKPMKKVPPWESAVGIL